MRRRSGSPAVVLYCDRRYCRRHSRRPAVGPPRRLGPSAATATDLSADRLGTDAAIGFEAGDRTPTGSAFGRKRLDIGEQLPASSIQTREDCIALEPGPAGAPDTVHVVGRGGRGQLRSSRRAGQTRRLSRTLALRPSVATRDRCGAVLEVVQGTDPAGPGSCCRGMAVRVDAPSIIRSCSARPGWPSCLVAGED